LPRWGTQTKNKQSNKGSGKKKKEHRKGEKEINAKDRRRGGKQVDEGRRGSNIPKRTGARQKKKKTEPRSQREEGAQKRGEWLP